MAKKAKKIKKEKKVLPDEVVLLDEACGIILGNADIAVELLEEAAFCIKCHGKRRR